MQTNIQVVCSGSQSMRSQIANRIQRLGAACEFQVVAERVMGRNPGWLKIKSTLPGVWGARNISWEPETRTLTCRVVNKKFGTPHRIAGRFVDFLLEHHKGRVKLISIFQV